MEVKKIKDFFKKIWAYLKKDTWDSWLVSLILVFVLIKFVLFPILSLLTGSALPLVVVESCSMYHGESFDNWWAIQGKWYEDRNITKEEFSSFTMKNGFNKGDILLVTKPKTYKEGDIIIFNANAKYPLIHRIVSISPIATKGDHNSGQLAGGNNFYNLGEINISEKDIIGKASIKLVPFLGWAKLIWFESTKAESDRGFCKKL